MTTPKGESQSQLLRFLQAVEAHLLGGSMQDEPVDYRLFLQGQGEKAEKGLPKAKVVDRKNA